MYMCVCTCVHVCSTLYMCVCTMYMSVRILVFLYMVNSISDDQAPNPKEELYTQWPLLWDQGSNHCQQMAAITLGTPNHC